MIYKYRDRDFTGIDGHMFVHNGITEENTPFYIHNLSNQVNTVTFQKRDIYTTTITIEISKNSRKWDILGDTSVEGISTTIPAYGILYIRSNNNDFGYNHIRMSHNSEVGGNIMSLIYGDEFNGSETKFKSLAGNNFVATFSGNDTLLYSSKLLLPAKKLQEDSYQSLFVNCTSLRDTPTIPAAELARNCCIYMFKGCSSLQTATCLFEGDIYGVTNWMDGVPATGTFYKKAGVTWPSGASGIPEGWTVVEV